MVTPTARSAQLAEEFERLLRTEVRRMSAVLDPAERDALGAVLTTVIAAGANPGFAPLTPQVFVSLTLLGTAAGYAGWATVARRPTRPAAVLHVLVPAVLALSMIPDLLLLATEFIPSASMAGVIALMLMHGAITVVAVPAYRWTISSSPRNVQVVTVPS